MVLTSENEADFERQRLLMVEEQLRKRGISDDLVLRAIAETPRHLFIPAEIQPNAYEDGPLPIGFDQTISQPYMVGLMTEKLCLTGSERVLEVGTGSGYQAAILSKLAAHVVSIEHYPLLSASARQVLARLGLLERIVLAVGDGSLGFPEMAPFDRIIVTAGSPRIPRSLLGQLAEGGILILPLGERERQVLIRVTKQGGAFQTVELVDCTFVPLVGEEGWQKADTAGWRIDH
jgi:protein-L-isoaspartate(D-aspartate) O-methyltransferase